jgi:hypothetical protein
MAEKIELGFPDIDRVTVHLDGKFVATMWAFDEEQGIPTELFNLMRAAPDMLAALKLLRDPEKLGRWTCYCEAPEHAGMKCENCVATDAINKAEGVS